MKAHTENLTTLQAVRAGLLAGLFRAYRKLSGAGGEPGPEAEELHVPSSDADYNESYYFNFTDPSRRIGGYTRIGILPNQESDIGVMMLFAGGGRLLAASESGRVAVEDGSFTIGNLAYERIETLRRWRVRYRGEMIDLPDSRLLPGVDGEDAERADVSVELSFEGLSSPFDFKNADPGAIGEMLAVSRTRLRDLKRISRVSSEHYEQAGLWTGELQLGEQQVRFEGSGHRDHSWGVRDWTAPRSWTWLTCQFKGEFSFNLCRVVIGSLDIFHGFVSRDGHNYPLRRASLETAFEEDGKTQREVRLYIEDTGGFSADVRGEVLSVIPLDLRERGYPTLVNEALALYRWKDVEGTGIAEYLHQLPGSAID